MKIKHKKVIEQWYEISFNAYHRTLGPKIDSFLEGSPNLDINEDRANELWHENHTVLRDYEGDFDGIEIYSNEITAPLIEFMCKKIGVKYSDIGSLNFKLLG